MQVCRPGPPRRRGSSADQAGVVLIFTLVALVLLTIAAVALIRSTDTSVVTAANIGFRRDLTNQTEYAVSLAKSYFATGGVLSGDTARQSNLTSVNYSSVILSTDPHGIPNAILNSSSATTPSDGTFTGSLVDLQAGNGVTIRFVIDRLCNQTGVETAQHCVLSTVAIDRSGTAWLQKAGGTSPPVYRLSMRVSGARNTQAFFQTTLTTQ